MLVPIVILLTIVGSSITEDSIRVFASSSLESSSSTAGQTLLTPTDPFSCSIGSNAHVHAIELVGNLFTRRRNSGGRPVGSRGGGSYLGSSPSQQQIQRSP